MQNLKALFSFSVMLALTMLALSIYELSAFASIILFTLLIWPWFSIFHSVGHNSYFTNRTLNDIVGYMASILVGIPFYHWKIHHAAHHKWTGWQDKDPTANEK